MEIERIKIQPTFHLQRAKSRGAPIPHRLLLHVTEMRTRKSIAKRPR